MTKIFFSVPHELIGLFYQVKVELESKGYFITNNFQDQEFLSFSGETVSFVNNQIYNADIVIAVDLKNPSVLFELGIASGNSKKIIIMERDESEIPSFLKDFYYLRWKDSMFLGEKIDHFIRTQIKSTIKPSTPREFNNLRDLMSASSDSISALDNLSPKDFESLVFDFFNSKGYNPINSTKNSFDYGYDIILTNYLGYNKTLVEIKKYSSNQRISITPIQQLLGAVMAYKADHSILVTSSGFTSSAISFSNKIESNKVELWDFDKLRQEVLA